MHSRPKLRMTVPSPSKLVLGMLMTLRPKEGPYVQWLSWDTCRPSWACHSH